MLKIKRLWVGSALILFTACAQERIVFHPAPLPADFAFKFALPYQEYNIAVAPGVRINALLFTAARSRGIVVYLHGNAGNNATWGQTSAPLYLHRQYDVLMFDYRGFGKSGGKIKSEAELYADNQKVYDFVKNNLGYSEDKIVIAGYSVGTGLAAKLAADNHPRTLILLAPYYSLPAVARQFVGIIPDFLVKYKVPTYKYLPRVAAPVYIFHGLDDQVISVNSSRRLSKIMPQAQVVYLPQQVHDGIENHPLMQQALTLILK